MSENKTQYTEMYFDHFYRAIMQDHSVALNNHARALAAHCECLRMNAANCFLMSVSPNEVLLYNGDDYKIAMTKWGLINEKGDPIL